MKAIIVLAVVACAVVSPIHAQAPRGYYVGASVFLPDSAREVLTDGRFQITIVRVAADSFEAKLLLLAERLFPDTAAFGPLAARETRPIVVSRLKAAAAAPGNRWWWDDYDDVWTPYAITGTAVQYYRQRIHDRAATGNPFASRTNPPSHQGEFSYRARVERLSPSLNAGASFVVRMELSWDYWCGLLCAVGFGAERRVFFTADGIPLRVEGDGKPMVVVS